MILWISEFKRGNKSIDKYIMILDLEGYSNKNMTMDNLKKLNPVFENYFPDVLKKMLIVNLSYMLKIVYKTIELFLHETTKQKVKLKR